MWTNNRFYNKCFSSSKIIISLGGSISQQIRTKDASGRELEVGKMKGVNKLSSEKWANFLGLKHLTGIMAMTTRPSWGRGRWRSLSIWWPACHPTQAPFLLLVNFLWWIWHPNVTTSVTLTVSPSWQHNTCHFLPFLSFCHSFLARKPLNVKYLKYT